MRRHIPAGEQGFSLVEMLIVLGITGTVAAMAMMVSPAYNRYARAEVGIAQTLDILQSARSLAVSQRRNVEVTFIGIDKIQTARVEVPSGAKTVLRTMQYENRLQFLLQSVGDTPDKFCPGTPTACTAIKFGTGSTSSLTRMFTSEGTFVDANGDPLNGTIFISVPGDTNSARAITIFGLTALLHAWRWNGTKWTE